MPAQLRLLDSDGATPLVSINFGNVLAGGFSAPRLLFMDSFGDSPCNQSEFGVEATSGNDGVTFAQVVEAGLIDNSGVAIAALVEATGGIIAAGASIVYKVTSFDRWNNQTVVNAAGVGPVFSVGATNKVTLTWGAVPGAFKYGVYSSISGGSFYKVGESSAAEFTDLNGTNDGITAPPVSGTAYVMDDIGWSAGPISGGDMAVGTKKAVGLRENVPLGTTATGNPRQHKVYVSFLTA
jgi:hypothetical protein